MGWGCICSLAQLTSHSRWGTPRVGHQSIRFLKQRQATFEAHTDAYRLFRIIIINLTSLSLETCLERKPEHLAITHKGLRLREVHEPLDHCATLYVCAYLCVFTFIKKKKKTCFKNLGFSYSNKLFFVRDHKWIQQMLILLRKNGKSKEFNVFIV